VFFVLEVRIKKTLPGFDLDVGFSVNDSILSIMGPSGSGKTMTLQCIAGITRPDEGSISINDKAVFDSSSGINLPARVRKVGFVCQNYALFPHLNVRENIAYGIRKLSREIREQTVSGLLSRMNIPELGERYPGQLSSGQQQRVALARALAPQPDILLLDEPFSALDIMNKEDLELELLSVQRSFSGSILFVTHDFSQGYSLGSKIAIYESGRIIQCDAKNKVIASPANITVAGLMGLKNLMAGYVSSVSDSEVLVAVPGLGCDIKANRNGNTTLTKGQPVTIGIRPESIRIVTNPGENTFPGFVDRIIEGLTSINYSLRLMINENSEHLLATVIKPDITSIREGQSCHIYVSSEHVVVIADSKVS
jgi:molybdate transport system ATP-binding protein